MATKDNNPGLLSKVAKFVRNPTRDWSELDHQDSQPDSGYTKQALKEMIERKRQNDFVRKREFDQLRKLRSRDPNRSSDQAGRPSFFQSSMPSNPDDRAMTLKKIDEIEAQMSKQWWKGKQEGALALPNSFPVSTQPPGGSDDPTLPGLPSMLPPASAQSVQPYAPTEVAPLRARAAANDVDEFAATHLGHSVPPGFVASDPNLTMRAPPRASDSEHPAPPPAVYQPPTQVPPVYSVDLCQLPPDPDLEDAAIRFANGDDAGAESGLLAALRAPDAASALAAVWLGALFDLYRATGNQERFDAMALEFAQSMGRSAPAWYSVPELLGQGVLARAELPGADPMVGEPIWTCPPELGLRALQQLGVAVAGAPAPWHLDWSPLTVIQADAIDALEQLLSDWCRQRLKFHFSGAGMFDASLRNLTPSGDKSVNPACWRLRLDALRIMRMQDEFELVALDYCVTYEVSPPSWREPLCEYLSEHGPSYRSNALSDTVIGDDDEEAEADRSMTIPMLMDGSQASLAEMEGEITGDAADVLLRLEAALHGGNRLVVSCARLIRVDFAAAGSILNWVADRQQEDCHVQFREVHRLVAVFFNVIGITEHAKVVARSH